MEEEHWVFAGTRLLTGEARVRVAYTGGETLYGEIVRSAIQGTHEVTPLQAAIGRLVKILIVAALVLCLALGAMRLYQGYGWLDALISAVTLATAAIPEEFSVVFTFFLGVGVYRMAQRQALVRRAVTVETSAGSHISARTRPGRSPKGACGSNTCLPPHRLTRTGCSSSRPLPPGPKAATRWTRRSSKRPRRRGSQELAPRCSRPSPSPRTASVKRRSYGRKMGKLSSSPRGPRRLSSRCQPWTTPREPPGLTRSRGSPKGRIR